MTYRPISLVLTLLAVLAPGALVTAGPASCDNRVNNNFRKLLECVTVDGVRQHQAAFQTIANACPDPPPACSPGTRSGS